MTKIKDMDFMSDAAMNEARIRELPDLIRHAPKSGGIRINMPDANGNMCTFEIPGSQAAGAADDLADLLYMGNDNTQTSDEINDLNIRLNRGKQATATTATPIPPIVWAIWIVGCSALGIWVFG